MIFSLLSHKGHSFKAALCLAPNSFGPLEFHNDQGRLWRVLVYLSSRACLLAKCHEM